MSGTTQTTASQMTTGAVCQMALDTIVKLRRGEITTREANAAATKGRTMNAAVNRQIRDVKLSTQRK